MLDNEMVKGSSDQYHFSLSTAPTNLRTKLCFGVQRANDIWTSFLETSDQRPAIRNICD